MDYFNDIEFVTYGYMTNSEIGTQDRIFDGYYGIQYLHSGALSVRTGDNPAEYFDKPGVFITYPGIPFTYGSPPGTSRNHVFICFRGPRITERYIPSGLLELRETNLFCRIINSEEYLRTACQLIQCLKTPDKLLHARAVWLLEELLLRIHVQPEISDKLYIRYSKKLENLRDSIAAAPVKKVDFKHEAARIGLSYVHFCRLFKELAGLPPGAFHFECRMRHAENLLINTDNRVFEIAQECGFNDAYHFSRIFKKHTKQSPRQFRDLYGNG